MVDRDKQGEADEDVNVDPLHVDLSLAEAVKRAGVRLDAFTLMDAAEDPAFAERVKLACEKVVDARGWAPSDPSLMLSQLAEDASVFVRSALEDCLATVQQARKLLSEARVRQTSGYLTRSEAVYLLSTHVPGWEGRQTQVADSIDRAAAEGVILYRHPVIRDVLHPTPDSVGGLYPWWQTDDGEAVIEIDRLNEWLHSIGFRDTLLQVPSGEAEPAQTGGGMAYTRPLATAEELIDAFGTAVGMDKSWFSNLSDRPGLKQARKVKGTGGQGRNYRPPLFCPREVMEWLTRPSRGLARPLSLTYGSQILQRKFPDAYAAYERERDGAID